MINARQLLELNTYLEYYSVEILVVTQNILLLAELYLPYFIASKLILTFFIHNQRLFGDHRNSHQVSSPNDLIRGTRGELL